MLIALRVALYVQFLLGVGRFFGMVGNPRVWELHVGLGAVIAVLALIGLRPHPKVGEDAMRTVARFLPLVVLLTGAIIMMRMMPGRGFTVFHMLLGIGLIGLVERAAGAQKRAEAGGA